MGQLGEVRVPAVGGIPAVPKVPRVTREGATTAAVPSQPAKEFAEYFVAELMRQAIPEGGLWGEVSGPEFSAYSEMFTDELSKMIEDQTGIAQMVQEAIDKSKGKLPQR